ncbi:erythromycin esterase family protein [Amycolatopsis nigrescens]|uniref:erythromycin esterase family protein n=1 Tax=Amycolatopsis nigrescens TaxID=381445 RepID=UPI00037C7105|nr:erythromycin esterase family protein [Amycolatopsis nigrescens]
MSTRHGAADWFRAHTHTLSTLDADAPLDELEPVRELVGDARVVAIGEGAHFVAEFGHARQRLIRFLAERCGFSVLAFEFGFAEGHPLDRWLRGYGAEGALAGMTGTTSSGLNGEMARWLRRHNTNSAAPLRFAGLDIPDAGGTLRPALEPVARYLSEVDPEAVPAVEEALAIGDRIAGRSMAVAAPRWARLARGEQTALTAVLSRLSLRFRAMAPHYVERSDQERYDLAKHHLEAAVHTDYMFATLHEVFAGGGLPGDASVRDRFMADSMRWHLRRGDPDARVVLVAHNSHIQKTPVSFDGQLAALPLGFYLSRHFGHDYRAIALTHTAGTVPEMYPDESKELGFEVTDTPLGPPTKGSVEEALIEAGFGPRLTYTDLRPLRTGQEDVLLDRIRMQSTELQTPVPEAFDGVLSVPTTTTEVTPALG